jgi:general secretion pathway protein H
MNTKNKGFTLIEIMIVVVIAAILMGAVVISFPDSSNDRLKEQGERFSALILLAQDESILQSEDFALSINDAGYSFYRRADATWEAYSEKPFINRKIDSDIKAELVVEALPVKLDKSSSKFAAPKKTKPQIVIYSSGEMTPFAYSLGNQEKSVFTIKFDGAGNLEKEFKPNE